MQDDFTAQIKGIEDLLAEETPDFTSWCTDFIDSDAINMFSPKIHQMASVTSFWETDELCETLNMAYTELKKDFDENERKMREELIIPVNGNQKDILKQNLIKLLNIMPFEVFIEKQHVSFRQNCYNDALLESDPIVYCSSQLPLHIDFSLWTEQNQVQACSVAFEEFEGLTRYSEECLNDFDAETCDPCTKLSDSLFEQYRQFM